MDRGTGESYARVIIAESITFVQIGPYCLIRSDRRKTLLSDSENNEIENHFVFEPWRWLQLFSWDKINGLKTNDASHLNEDSFLIQLADFD